MNIIYNDVDISNSVQPITLKLKDYAGGKPDSIVAVFSDTEGLWGKWGSAKNDTIRIQRNGFDTGVMYIDQITQRASTFELKALSIPQNSKTARSKAWEEVRLLEIVTEIAARYGFTFQTYGVINHLYERVDQIEEADFSFLSYRCMLEGYSLKINNKSLVIFNEMQEEQKPIDQQNAVIQRHMINGNFEFTDKSTDIYSRCLVRSQTLKGYIQGEHSDLSIFGPTLKQNLYAANLAEANRWAKGLLRSFNKHMVTGSFNIDLNTGYAAGTNVEVRDVGMFTGKYIIDHLVHDLLKNLTKLSIRKPLEGY